MARVVEMKELQISVGPSTNIKTHVTSDWQWSHHDELRRFEPDQ